MRKINHNLTMKILIGFFLINLSLLSQADTVNFTSEKVGLILITNNLDSIKYYPDSPPPNPFGPDMNTYSVRINTYDSTKLIIKIKDINQEDLIIYIWDSIPPGSYKFDWWQYAEFRRFPSGKYYGEKIYNNKTETSKIIFIK